MRTLTKTAVAALCATVLALSMASAAVAQSPTDAQYGDTITNISKQTGTPSGGTTGGGTVLEKRVVSPLPFTGLDLVSLFAVAVALLSTGMVVRRVIGARQPTPTV